MKTTIKQQIRLLVFIFLYLYSVYDVSGQDVKKQGNSNNEFKINMGSLLFEFPEVSYEHIVNEESSIGISVAFPIDRVISYRFIAYPNYRLFFGKKRAAGFFIEVNSAIFSQRISENFLLQTIADSAPNSTKLGFGLGLAVGGKFLSKNGFIGEIYLGAGRNFINTDKIDEAYPRIGVSVGKRF